ncbi:molybdopterin converting factor subunit 1 [Balneolaceae bacterium YR4-1]|uniref:Molybdopterin converting factor subunit 1 n=1 Tax=Halalkalibaculum roseum TaxID=2709311 RepID=A0A6M1T3T6_9BACT|nr:molybdopterin converting factor subunit 1 [Halalkalibaculum roseum]NGP75033.1 molybdopterin converting factor subunit 1 [Halalkalibaculum roseum]
MSITVKYFGAVAEQTGTSEEELNLDETGNSVAQLKAYCVQKYDLEEEETIQLAVNQVLNAGEKLEEGDEVAFLPPYAGG